MPCGWYSRDIRPSQENHPQPQAPRRSRSSSRFQRNGAAECTGAMQRTSASPYTRPPSRWPETITETIASHCPTSHSFPEGRRSPHLQRTVFRGGKKPPPQSAVPTSSPLHMPPAPQEGAAPDHKQYPNRSDPHTPRHEKPCPRMFRNAPETFRNDPPRSRRPASSPSPVRRAVLLPHCDPVICHLLAVPFQERDSPARRARQYAIFFGLSPPLSRFVLRP